MGVGKHARVEANKQGRLPVDVFDVENHGAFHSRLQRLALGKGIANARFALFLAVRRGFRKAQQSEQ